MSFHFDNSDYERSHGKAPRGRGYWAFRLRTVRSESEPYFVPGDLLLSEARRAALDHFKRVGGYHYGTLITCP